MKFCSEPHLKDNLILARETRGKFGAELTYILIQYGEFWRDTLIRGRARKSSDPRKSGIS